MARKRIARASKVDALEQAQVVAEIHRRAKVQKAWYHEVVADRVIELMHAGKRKAEAKRIAIAEAKIFGGANPCRSLSTTGAS